jgi:hypothetical protein
LTIGEPFDRSLVDKMKDASAGSSSSEIMHEVGGICKGSDTDRFASWSRHVMRKFFFGFTINTASPIKEDICSNSD